ncbi:MAG: penicillin-binding transpeptidase domain-containing protein [Candidatus Muirbacterium halophilum]|nr:penicillin-binding transpeptidase domain-containing protein [Candidatus Muirbacterium halophilum]
MFLIVLIRLYQVQFLQKNIWTNEANSVYKKNIEVIGRRGSILDRNLNELSTSVLAYSMYLIPKEIKDISVFLDKISLHVDFDRERMEGLFKRFRNNSFLWFKRGIDPKTYRIIKDMNLSGVNFKKEYKRVYPEGSLASNIIGMVGIEGKTDFYDNKGLEGLENYFDKDLASQKTMLEIMTDNRGYSVFSQEPETIYNEYNGSDVILTIDKVIQYWAEQELEKVILEHAAKKGYIIVMDVNSFDLLAVANYPTFSPDEFSKYPSSSYKNLAFIDVYEPGSTFKTLIAAIALANGKFDLQSRFKCNGSIKVDKGPEIRCEKAHGDISLEEALAYSCNVAMVDMALSMEYENIYSKLREFGFGEKTGVPFLYEEKGVLVKPERMNSKRDIASTGFGYRIAVTGIQMARSYAALVNGGLIKTPRLVSCIEKNGEILRKIDEENGIRVIPEETSDKIRKILSAVVEYGTAQSVKMVNFSVGGKTGTAKKAHSKGYYDDKYISSFIGTFPVENPKILIYVVVDDPQSGSYYGSTLAAPAFRNIAQNIVDYMKISPDTYKQEKVESEKVIVPNFTGIAKNIFFNRVNMLGIKYKSYGAGDFVVFQEPAQGSIVEKDREIDIYFGNPSINEDDKLISPDLRGFTMRKALRILNKLKLKYEINGNGIVKIQTPAPGTEIDKNSIIRLEFTLE